MQTRHNRHHRSPGLKLWLIVLLAIAAALAPLAPSAATDPDIIFIVMDDAGIEQFDFYDFRDAAGPYATTEFLSDKDLNNELTLFNNAWSNPLCSPTRATLHTGDFAFRTGIGDVINDDTVYGLDVDNTDLLPKLLASTAGSTTAYKTGMFGKWHLGTSADQDDNRAPDSAGYDEFHALFLDEQDQPFDDPKDTPYFRFTIFRTADDPSDPPVEENFDAKIDDQDPNNDDKSVYLTSEIIDRAIDWINAREENNETYFAYIPFFAPHGPFHCPLEGADTPYPNETFECTQNPGNDESFRSMIHTIDFEIERLLDETSTDPLVIIVSDNGTPSSLTTDPWDSNKAKGTVGQGGVLVPFIAFGDTVQLDQEIDQSVSVNDLYATILDFAGKHSLLPSPTDSKSLKGLLEGGSSAPHVYNYTETFFPNFEPGSGFGPCRGQQAVQEDPGEYVTDTYKYIRRVDGQEALYELDGDFDETDNLINSVPDANRLQDLKDHIDQSLDSDLASICDGKLDTGESCTDDSDCCSNMCSNTIMTCVCPL